MPRKMIGTLTLSSSNFVHISKPPIIFYKSSSVATPKHSKPFSLEKYVCIVAFMPDLQMDPFYSVIEFLYYIFTIKLLSL